MNSAFEAYSSIFELVPETCKVARVRLDSSEKNESGGKVHKFCAIVEAPTGLPDTDCGQKECKALRKRFTSEFTGGPDIVADVSWETKKDGKNKTKRYMFTAHLTPEYVKAFKIENGLFHIMTVCYGTFY